LLILPHNASTGGARIASNKSVTEGLLVAVTGFVNGETAETALSYTVPVVVNNNTAAGIYELTPSGGSAANYRFTYIGGTLTISSAGDNNMALTIVLSVLLLAGVLFTVFFVRRH
jgi:hypothetical protein